MYPNPPPPPFFLGFLLNSEVCGTFAVWTGQTWGLIQSSGSKGVQWQIRSTWNDVRSESARGKAALSQTVFYRRALLLILGAGGMWESETLRKLNLALACLCDRGKWNENSAHPLYIKRNGGPLRCLLAGWSRFMRYYLHSLSVKKKCLPLSPQLQD